MKSQTSTPPSELQPDSLAKKFFVIAMLGVFAYVAIVIGLMASSG